MIKKIMAKKSAFWQDFKAFAMRGNVIDMAVGIIIGGAFGKIVSSLVSSILMPPIGMLIGGVDFSDIKLTLKKAGVDAAGNPASAVTMDFGDFMMNVIDFLIIAFCIFIIIRMLGKLQRKKEEAPAAPAPVPDDVKLLTEIRDLLKSESKKEEKKTK